MRLLLWGAFLALCGVVTAIRPARTWWVRRAWTDPSRDPGARLVHPSVQQALSTRLGDPSTPTERLADGLALCEIDDRTSWRGGLRQLEPLAAQLGAGPDADALRAELHLRLGRIAPARELMLRLPADHWRACFVRSGLYAIEGDEERADSALVAAAQLADPKAQARLYRHLALRRRRRGIRVGPDLSLWELPPGS